MSLYPRCTAILCCRGGTNGGMAYSARDIRTYCHSAARRHNTIQEESPPGCHVGGTGEHIGHHPHTHCLFVSVIDQPWHCQDTQPDCHGKNSKQYFDTDCRVCTS